MNLSRRDLAALIPVIAAAQQPAAKPTMLPSKLYHSDQIPYTGDDKKKGRRFFQGTTHTGFNLEVHETILGPGEISHPPHKHVNEEIIVILEGLIEANVEGKLDRAGAGSISYFASNEMHNFKNVGTTPCRYCVIELHGDNT